MLTSGHERRDYQWGERFRHDRDDEGGGGGLYSQIRADPRTGRPPSAEDRRLLAAAQPDG